MYSNLATVPASMPAENSFELLTQFHGNAQAEREMNGFPMSFDRIKIPSAGGTIFEVPSLDGVKATPAQEITGVVLYHHPMQSYYKQQGLAFVMLVSGLVECEVREAVARSGLGMSVADVLMDARAAKADRVGDAWVVNNCLKKRADRFRRLGVAMEAVPSRKA